LEVGFLTILMVFWDGGVGVEKPGVLETLGFWFGVGFLDLSRVDSDVAGVRVEWKKGRLDADPWVLP
jgi:hypothetical protein